MDVWSRSPCADEYYTDYVMMIGETAAARRLHEHKPQERCSACVRDGPSKHHTPQKMKRCGMRVGCCMS